MILRFKKARIPRKGDWFCWDSADCNFPSDMRYIFVEDLRAWFLKWVGGRK